MHIIGVLVLFLSAGSAVAGAPGEGLSSSSDWRFHEVAGYPASQCVLSYDVPERFHLSFSAGKHDDLLRVLLADLQQNDGTTIEGDEALRLMKAFDDGAVSQVQLAGADYEFTRNQWAQSRARFYDCLESEILREDVAALTMASAGLAAPAAPALVVAPEVEMELVADEAAFVPVAVEEDVSEDVAFVSGRMPLSPEAEEALMMAAPQPVVTSEQELEKEPEIVPVSVSAVRQPAPISEAVPSCTQEEAEDYQALIRKLNLLERENYALRTDAAACGAGHDSDLPLKTVNIYEQKIRALEDQLMRLELDSRALHASPSK